jgi:hypothetical protein
VAQPEGSRAVKVGVVLARPPDELGGWLADAAAFEAAGAYALCIDTAPEPELDPLALTAALAAVTFRSLLITSLPAAGSPAMAGTLGTIRRLSHGRLRILADAIPPGDLADAIPPGDLADLALRLGVFRRVTGDAEAFEHVHGPGEAERWISVPSPDSRAAWRQTLLDASGRGPAGLLVPAGPRLLDILRNPDDQGGRHDLRLAQG